jgi:ketosteroid isomerase-like protein
MTRRALAGCVGAVLGLVVHAAALAQTSATSATSAPSAASAPAAPPPAVHSAAECVVWQRELSFARSVEAHDTKAFAAHLHPGAVFNAGSRRPLRGAATVAQAWAEIVEGRTFVLRWRPGVVAIGGDPNVALSRGPFYSENPDAEPKDRFKVGFFHSVWLRDAASGEWRILFDGPDGPPRAVASVEEGRAFVAAQSGDSCVTN